MGRVGRFYGQLGVHSASVIQCPAGSSPAAVLLLSGPPLIRPPPRQRPKLPFSISASRRRTPERFVIINNKHTSGRMWFEVRHCGLEIHTSLRNCRLACVHCAPSFTAAQRFFVRTSGIMVVIDNKDAGCFPHFPVSKFEIGTAKRFDVLMRTGEVRQYAPT